MANISNLTQLFYGQVETVDNPNPRLISPVGASGLVFTLTAPIEDEDGAKPSRPFLATFLNASDNKPLSIYVSDPSTELSTDKKVITLASLTQKGIALAGQNGIDFVSGSSARRFDLVGNSEFRISVSPLSQQMLEDCLTGDLGSTLKVNESIIWDITATDVADSMPVYASVAAAEALITSPVHGYRYYATSEGAIRQYVGGSWANAASGATANGSTTVAGKYEEATVAEQGTASATGGTGARLVMANANIKKTSAGAGDENKLAILNSSGQFATGFIGGTADATSTEIGQLSSTTNIAEANTFFGATNISGAEAETLTDGSNADSLHGHSIYVSGKVTDLSTSSAANNDIAVTGLVFRPSFVKLTMTIKGHDSITQTSSFFFTGGIVTYEATTLKTAIYFFFDDSTPTLSWTPTSTDIPLAGGTGGGGGAIKITVSMLSIENDGFTIRRATTVGAGGGTFTATATIAWEVFA